MTTQWQDLVNVHTPIFSFLICLGLSVNGMFLMSLKADKPKLNYSDKVQVVKTIFVILAIIFYIPTELWIMQKGNVTVVACLVKETLQSIFLDAYPVGITTVAIIRFRLAICRGNADMLVSKLFYILTTVCPSLILLIMATTKICVRIYSIDKSHNTTGEEHLINCFDTRYYGVNYLNVSRAVVMYALPSVVVTFLYAGIICISSSSITRLQQYTDYVDDSTASSMFRRTSIIPSFMQQNRVYPIDQLESPNSSEHQTRGEKIWKSVTILVMFFLITTIPVCLIEIYISIYNPEMFLEVILLYLKIFMCVFHAVGEGTFCRDKRRRVMIFLYKYVIRTSVTTTITRRMSPDVVQRTIFFHNNAHLSTLSEESNSDVVKDSRDSVFMPDGISPSNAGRISYSQVSGLTGISRSVEALRDIITNQGVEQTINNCGENVNGFLSIEAKSPQKQQQQREETLNIPQVSDTRKRSITQRSPVKIFQDNNLSPRQIHRCKRSSFLQYSVPVMSTRKRSSSSRRPSRSPQFSSLRTSSLEQNDALAPSVYAISDNVPEVLFTPRRRTSYDRLHGLSSVSSLDVEDDCLSPVSLHAENAKKLQLEERVRNLSLLSDTL